MKLIILLSFLICALSANPLNKLTLEMTYSIFTKLEIPSANPALKQFANNANQECVKEKMNFAENGKKKIGFEVASYFVLFASSFCLNDEKAGFNMIINESLEKKSLIEELECCKRRLQELEPTSKFLKNYTADPQVICDFTKIVGLEEAYNAKYATYVKIGLNKCISMESKRKEFETIHIKGLISKSMQNTQSGIPEDVEEELFSSIKNRAEEGLKCLKSQIEASSDE